MGYSAIAHALICYVESHLDDFCMEDMSGSFGFSEAWLRELFLAHTGMPVMSYYRRRRLIASGFEILHSDRKIIDIALESGFSSHESFTRAFHKLFGMSPSRFRVDRPLMGRRQLDVGVFGLDLLTDQSKRSEYINMDGQTEQRRMLYGIRKIEQGAYGSNTMFPICIKAVSEYLGEDISYARIMAATGAAFRLTWNQADWDLSNVDMYHTLRESNEIYSYGAKAVGREFFFLGREETTKKEEFVSFIKHHLGKGYPVIALGIIGPPEPCIVAGCEADGSAVMGWNFFQQDPEFAPRVKIMENGYFWTDQWWENTDTQALMCLGQKEGMPRGDEEIVKMAVEVMSGREEHSYAKGIQAYDAWRRMLSEGTWFEEAGSFDRLFSKLLVHNDAVVCVRDGRRWGAEYFRELSETYSDNGSKILCRDIAKCLGKASGIAGEMMSLLGDWSDTEGMLRNLADPGVRRQLCEKIVLAGEEDARALEQMKQLQK